MLVDDQPLVRTGLRALLDPEADMGVVGEAGDERGGLDIIRRTVPDVVLMDIRMPEGDGRSALRAITADPALTAVRVIMLTTFEHDDYIFDSLRDGASGFLLKDAEPADMLRAIRVVAAGGSILSPAVTRRVIEWFAARRAADPPPDLAVLTDREREILAWVGTGRSNEQIAAALVLSPATVRTHIGRAMIKLRARDRAQLVVFALHAGLPGPGTPLRPGTPSG
ncbi:response regulator [Nocardia crassostreae]|uniref:response regulator n=1 Tax=Nocardia crassostreae TaxID=53428 RepID=UPI00350E46C9